MFVEPDRCADEGSRNCESRARRELQDELLELRREQFNLRMEQATGPAAKPDQFSKVRRNIARVKTVHGRTGPRGAANEGSK